MSDQPNHRKATLLVLLVFILGAALGGVGAYALMKRSFAAPGGRLTQAQRHEHFFQQLTRELSLTPDQQKRVDEILTQLQARFKVIHEQRVPQFEEAKQQARNAIRTTLTPEQVPKFEEFFRRFDEERVKKSKN